MGRPTRDVRRRSFDFSDLNAGDYVVLAATVVMFIALLGNWWVNGLAVNAAYHSQLYFVIELVLLLLTVVLVVYPLVHSELGLRPLPFATPPIMLAIGFLLLLTTTYELGRYTGVGVIGIGAGFGLWMAFVAAWVYLLGAVIKWGGRQRRLQG
ncbi:MAG TPA: hypothetical protein VFB34_07625 [Chloroflexota bacterium]|nr:hypothetical protein [Chloroflexota bacterium]